MKVPTWRTLNSWNPLGHSRPVTGLVYILHPSFVCDLKCEFTQRIFSSEVTIKLHLQNAAGKNLQKEKLRVIFLVQHVWKVMAHAQKPHLVFQRNGRVHLNWRVGLGVGGYVQSTTGSRGVRISGSNAGYTMFRGSAKSTGYPNRSPVSPSLPLPTSPCTITFQLESTSLMIVNGRVHLNWPGGGGGPVQWTTGRPGGAPPRE